MKKTILLLLLILSTFGYSQKKKTTKAPAKTVLATVDTVSAEIITDKKQKKIVLFSTNGTAKDTLEVKKIDSPLFTALNFSIKSFTANGVKLYIVHWEEKNKLETKLKKEDIDITESQIWNIEKKELLIGNTQKSTHIIETVFLDKNKTASEVQEKNRKEGFMVLTHPLQNLNLKKEVLLKVYLRKRKDRCAK